MDDSFTGRTDVEAETPILWSPDVKSWLIWKDPDAGKDWGQEEKGMTEDEMVGWHHWLNGHGFGWTPGAGDGQKGLVCCGSWGRKESETTERLNWTELVYSSNHLTECSHSLTRVVVEAQWRVRQFTVDGSFLLPLSSEMSLGAMCPSTTRGSLVLKPPFLWYCVSSWEDSGGRGAWRIPFCIDVSMEFNRKMSLRFLQIPFLHFKLLPGCPY